MTDSGEQAMKVVVITDSQSEHDFAVQVDDSFDGNDHTEKMALFLNVQREIASPHENFTLVATYDGNFQAVTDQLKVDYPQYSWMSWSNK